MPKPTIETTPYELWHGRSPRGRGVWAFCPFSKRNAEDRQDWIVASPPMTFTEAKKWVAAQDAFQGVGVIAVMPEVDCARIQRVL